MIDKTGREKMSYMGFKRASNKDSVYIDVLYIDCLY